MSLMPQCEKWTIFYEFSKQQHKNQNVLTNHLVLRSLGHRLQRSGHPGCLPLHVELIAKDPHNHNALVLFDAHSTAGILGETRSSAFPGMNKYALCPPGGKLK